MSKLILVSNREPFLLRRTAPGEVQAQRITAGLLGALEPVVQATSGHWISWSGFDREAPRPGGEPLPERLSVTIGAMPWTLRRIPLTEREASLHYYGCALRTLAPLMHLQLGRVQFDAEAWRAYRRVNQRFADAVLEAYEPGDRIWVHDYHLALVPRMLRQAIPDAKIGFSWHIPWAPIDALRALPWSRELVDGVLGADQIGFQLPRYARAFAAACDELAPGDRTARAGAFPIGCDFERWDARGRAARGGRAVRLRRNLVAEKLALAVDRLDHTRGIVERLRAVERFFDRYPSWRGRLVFCQIAVPSRTRVEEYRDMKKEIDGIVERINARFAKPSKSAWVPVRYLYRSFEPDELAVYYASADVALVTPLADGLSFVPFEYAAARTREDGALVLSSLAGAADALPDASVVNPYDEEAVASSIHEALELRPEESRRRMRALRERAKTEDVGAWLSSFWRATWNEELPRAEASAPAPAEPASQSPELEPVLAAY